jgi:hypothetical protein
MMNQGVKKTADLTRCSPLKAAVQLYEESAKKSRIEGKEGWGISGTACNGYWTLLAEDATGRAISAVIVIIICAQ